MPYPGRIFPQQNAKCVLQLRKAPLADTMEGTLVNLLRNLVFLLDNLIKNG